MFFGKNHKRGRLRDYMAGGLLIILGPMVLSWSWNKLAVELFALPPSKYVHGIALMAAIATIGMAYQMLRSFGGAAEKHNHGTL